MKVHHMSVFDDQQYWSDEQRKDRETAHEGAQERRRQEKECIDQEDERRLARAQQAEKDRVDQEDAENLSVLDDQGNWSAEQQQDLEWINEEAKRSWARAQEAEKNRVERQRADAAKKKISTYNLPACFSGTSAVIEYMIATCEAEVQDVEQHRLNFVQDMERTRRNFDARIVELKVRLGKLKEDLATKKQEEALGA